MEKIKIVFRRYLILFVLIFTATMLCLNGNALAKVQVVKKSPILTIHDIKQDVIIGTDYKLPNLVQAVTKDYNTKMVPVKWNKNTVNLSTLGTQIFVGKVDGYNKTVTLKLNVVKITLIGDISIVNNERNIVFPKKVKAQLSNGNKTDVDVTVDINNVEKSSPGIYIYNGKVKGYDGQVKLTIDRRLYDKCVEILSTITKPEMSNFEKEKAIHDYLVWNTSYDGTMAASNPTYPEFDIIMNGKGSNIIRAFQRLLNIAGIEYKEISGELCSEGKWYSAVWNLVKLDGEYYHVDIFWDQRYASDFGSFIRHEYFNLTDKEISKDHRWNKALYPACTSEEYDDWAKQEREVQEKVSQIIGQIIKPNMSDIDKEIAIHEYVLNNVKYDRNSLDKYDKSIKYDTDLTDTAYGALINGNAMCKGYSEAMRVLCESAGLECIDVSGSARTGNGKYFGHAWNIVKIAGEYYQVDATFDDPGDSKGNERHVYNYLNLTNSEMSKDHMWDTSKYPSCTSTKYNFKNLDLPEKDDNGNLFIKVYSIDELYNTLIDATKNHKDKVSVKIVNYTPEYDKVFDKVIKDAKLHSLGRWTKFIYDTSGSKYYTLDFKY